jgi:ATP-binding cassette subfamily B protein
MSDSANVREDLSGARLSWGDVLRRAAPLFRPHARALAACSVVVLALAGAQLGLPLLIRRVIDVDVPRHDVRGLALTVGAYAALLVLYVAGSWAQRVRVERMGQDVILDLRERLCGKLLRQSIAFHDQHASGRLVARVQGDTDALRRLFSATVVTLVEMSVLFLGVVVVMAAISWPLALVVATVTPLFGVTAVLLARAGAPRYRAVRERAAEVSSFVAERVQGASIVQAFGREAATSAAMDDLNRSKFRAHLAANWLAVAMHQGIFCLEVLALVLTLALGGAWVASGAMTLGTLVMFVDYLRRLFGPLRHLAEQLVDLQRAVAAGSRTFALLESRPTVEDPSIPAPCAGLAGDLELRHVTFSYRGDGERALRDVSLVVPEGQHWAVVGATGSGKSSIVNLLLRFYDPHEGQVLIGGTDVRAVSQEDARRHVALVHQDVQLFPGDLMENIAPDGRVHGPEDEARLRAVAHEAGIADVVERLPQGWSTQLAERGANLSAGERQLLAFARALAKDPQVLVLDEATSSVDPDTEARVQAALRRLLRGRTALVIAHRLSTVQDADQILVMERGRIVERGTHAELMARGGVYADLAAHQFRDDAPVADGAADETAGEATA